MFAIASSEVLGIIICEDDEITSEPPRTASSGIAVDDNLCAIIAGGEGNNSKLGAATTSERNNTAKALLTTQFGHSTLVNTIRRHARRIAQCAEESGQHPWLPLALPLCKVK